MSDDIKKKLENSANTNSINNAPKNINKGNKTPDINSSFEFLSSVQRVGKNPDEGSRTKLSVDSFIYDPEHVEFHNHFCDGLVEKGCSLEKAIVTTDIVFDNLKEEKTYD